MYRECTFCRKINGWQRQVADEGSLCKSRPWLPRLISHRCQRLPLRSAARPALPGLGGLHSRGDAAGGAGQPLLETLFAGRVLLSGCPGSSSLSG